MRKPYVDIFEVSILSSKQVNALVGALVFMTLLCGFLLYKGLTWTPLGICTVALNPVVEIPKEDVNESNLAAKISTAYGVDTPKIRQIVKFSKAYEDKVFPTYKDILAIIAVESSFNASAENQGAYGLMQIQLQQHKGKAYDTKSLKDPFHNIAVGVNILKEYYLILKSKEGAIVAYQSGPEPVLNGTSNTEYLEKFKKIRTWLG